MNTLNPQSIDPQDSQRKPWFAFNSQAMDVSRILASISIFYCHIGLFGSWPFSSQAEKGVEYFIFLAGISYLLFSKIKPSNTAAFAVYLKRRFLALFPIYWLINAVVFVVGYVHPSTLGRPFTPFEFLASSAGISQYLGWRYLTSPMWFIPFIMQVYILLPLVDWLLGRVNAVVVMLMAVAISWLLALWVSVSVHTDLNHLCWICKMWSPVFRLPDVCVGLILGRAMISQGREQWSGLAAIVVFGLLSFCAQLPQQGTVFTIFYLPWAGFVTPAILFVLTFMCLPAFSLMPAQLLRLLGRATLPFFLLQCAPLLAIEHAFGNRALVWLIYFFVCWLLAVACVVGLDKLTKSIALAPKTA